MNNENNRMMINNDDDDDDDDDDDRICFSAAAVEVSVDCRKLAPHTLPSTLHKSSMQQMGSGRSRVLDTCCLPEGRRSVGETPTETLAA